MKNFPIFSLLVFFTVLSCQSKKKLKTSFAHIAETKRQYETLRPDSLRYYFSLFEKAMAPRGADKIIALSYDGISVADNRKIHTHYYHQRRKGFWVKINYSGQNIYPLVFTTEKQIKWNGQAYESLSDEEKKHLMPLQYSDWLFLPFYLYNNQSEFRKISRVQDIDGRSVWGFYAGYKKHKFHFYFDKKHKFLIRLEKLSPAGNIDFSIDFMDFRPVNGNYLAHYWIYRNRASNTTTKFIWKKIKINYIETLKF